MGIRIDGTTAGLESSEPKDRLVRMAVILCLSPAILAVFAIGMIGMVAERIGKPNVKATAEGLHQGHRAAGPMAMAKKPTQVREMV